MIRKDKMKKEMASRISAFMLATTLCVSSCPVSVLAEESPSVDNSTGVESVSVDNGTSMEDTTENATMPEEATSEIGTLDDTILEDTDSQEFQIKEITLEDTTLKLTDDVLYATVDVEVKADGNLEGVSYIELQYVQYEDGNERTLYAHCSYDETTKTFKGQMGAGYGNISGIFTLERVIVNGNEITCDIVSTVEVVKTNTDVTGPVVEDFYFKHNGKEFKNGSTVKSTDKLEVFVKILDESELAFIGLDFSTDYEGVDYEDRVSVEFVKDSETGEWEKTADGYYKGIVNIKDAYPTEWYMSLFWFCDEYQNYVTNPQPEGLFENYFCIEKDGECILPEYTYDVYCYVGGDSIQKKVTTGKSTSLKELFPDGMPEVPTKEGSKFIGWSVESGGQDIIIADENAEIIVHKYNNVTIKPVYDKVDITFSIQYCNNVGEVVREEIKKTVDYTITYGELEKMVDLTQYKHWEGVVFEQWDCYYFNEEVANEKVMEDTYIRTDAVYNKEIVKLSYWYYDESGVRQFVDQKALAVEKGALIKEVIEAIETSELKDIVHSEKAGFQGWKYDEYYLQNLDKEISEYFSIHVQPMYEKEYITPDVPEDDENTDDSETQPLDIKITDIKVSNKDIVLTDDNRLEQVPVTISVEGAYVEQLTDGQEIVVTTKVKGTDLLESWTLGYDSKTKQFKGTFSVAGAELKEKGTYEITEIWLSGIDEFLSYKETILFTVTNNKSDKEVPVVKGLQVLVNNKVQTDTKVVLKKGDVITIRANVEDKNSLEGNLWLLQDNRNWVTIPLTTGQYDLEGTFKCDKDGEYQIAFLSVADCYHNAYTYGNVATFYKDVTPNQQNAVLIGNKDTSETLTQIGKNIKDIIKTEGAVDAQTKENIENALKAGHEITPEVSVSSLPPSSVQSDVRSKVQEKADAIFGKDTKVAYLDIDVDLFANGSNLGTLKKLDKEIAITVKLPKDLQGDYNYKVIRSHENADGTTEVTVLDATKNADGTITFKTDRFSTYAIAYSTNTASDTGNTGNGGTGTGTTSPITGQTGMMALYLTLAVAGTIVFKKREQK